MSSHYDVIVIGSGPGGAAVAQRLAPSGKRILILERGGWLERSPDNWSPAKVFIDGAYEAHETWYDGSGDAFHPGLHYFVGGNSKMYGAALFRLRERDFDEVRHADGISPAWPLKYDVFEPYYNQAERLYHVHGAAGEDPTEPPRSRPYTRPPVAHEPRMQQLCDTFTTHGLHPFHMPLGILLDERDGVVARNSPCIRCSAFDGYPCPTNGKADAEVISINPTLAQFPNVALLTGAYVSRLDTDASGHAVTGVQVEHDGQPERYSADIVVVACGALSSALLLLRSANEKHPHGLANGSDQVGRNYIRHNQSVLMAITKQPNDTVFQKTVGVSDFYFGAPDWPHPMGLIQMTGKSHADTIRGEALPTWLEWLPEKPFEYLAQHALDFWLSSEDLPRPGNCIRYDGERVVVEQTDNNLEAHRRLRAKLQEMLEPMGADARFVERKHYLHKDIPIGGTAHQAGTARFGTDPASSVLDLHCKAHELDNLYLADASFFPSIGAVNPTLTIIANALRVADHIAQRIK
ncbi:MAG: GMC family oxidoreductase [Nevskiaceae bacterium]|nr:MAG: GMC family oxidoreductase [Nevskiaceae bacterium]TBR73884.1 MAG: GMC family oxidoreductase [Nevskiaceae bacterium]